MDASAQWAIFIQIGISAVAIIAMAIYAIKHPRSSRSQSQCLEDRRNMMMQSSLDQAANAAEKTARIADIERTDNTSRRWTSYK